MKLPTKYPGRIEPDLFNFDKSATNLFNIKAALPKSRDRIVDGKLLTEKEYGRRHGYVRRRKPKPELCEICNEKPSRHLANKDHKYDVTRLDSWFFVCDSCHHRWDFDHNLRISSKSIEEILASKEVGG